MIKRKKIIIVICNANFINRIYNYRINHYAKKTFINERSNNNHIMIYICLTIKLNNNVLKLYNIIIFSIFFFIDLNVTLKKIQCFDLFNAKNVYLELSNTYIIYIPQLIRLPANH